MKSLSPEKARAGSVTLDAVVILIVKHQREEDYK